MACYFGSGFYGYGKIEILGKNLIPKYLSRLSLKYYLGVEVAWLKKEPICLSGSIWQIFQKKISWK